MILMVEHEYSVVLDEHAFLDFLKLFVIFPR